MMRHRKARWVFVASVFSLLILGGAAWWKTRPLHADTPESLLENGFVRLNRSDVIYRRKNHIGWEELRAQMQQLNASPREINGVLKTAKTIVALPSMENSFTFSLWPVLARETYLRGEKVWLIEAAAPPGKGYMRCDFGLSPQQVLERTKRAPETCVHRIVFVSAQNPYRAISLGKDSFFHEIYQ